MKKTESQTQGDSEGSFLFLITSNSLNFLFSLSLNPVTCTFITFSEPNLFVCQV